MTPDSVRRRRHRSGVRALAALLLGLALAPGCVAAAVRTNFDHLTTGFELIGQHRDLPCESCHVNAMFQGTPKDCGACHGIGSLVRATSKPANHILSTDQCGACHTPIAWNPAVNFDHTQARGSCSTCHNGTMAQGKGPTHIVTDLECDACHTTLTWAGAMFSHVGVTSGCAACHDNVHATGPTANHIPVGTPMTACESCHSPTNYTNWLGATMNHLAVTALSCAGCHQTASFLGMHPSTDTTAGDSRPSAKLDPLHPTAGDCSQCHDTTTFSQSASRPTNHIPTSAPCLQCHTTAGNYALYSVTATHQGVTGCLSCHGAGVGPFTNITIVGAPANHFPVGSLDCNGSGCHSTSNVSPSGFKLGSASLTAPTLSVAGHTTVAAGVPACQTCHEGAPYMGMIAGGATAWGDSRPQAFDKAHPAIGDCNGCHSTTPTFAVNQSASSAAKPANHIPTSAPCAQCHTTAGNYALYDVTATHQGVTNCLSCHGSTVNTTFANITMVTSPGNHIPFGSLDCNGSGCHTTSNVNAGGFNLGSASLAAPTLSMAGHTTVAAAVAACQTCHESAPYLGMIASSAAAWGDSRPQAFDMAHPAAGDCTGCHTTTPTFATDITQSAKPANHIPTTAPCTQCHTTAGNYAQYSSPGTHQGVTDCLSCHGPNAGTFSIAANPVFSILPAPANHIPFGSLDCNGSGCHATGNVTPGGSGFKLGTASISSPTLNAAGHTTVTGGGIACAICHEAAPYLGMVASSNGTAGDSRPNTTLDAKHPATGDCGACHVETPTFATNLLPTSTKPSNHIPTSAACAQCHTTAGNFALYDVTGVHQGITGCLSCHGPNAGTFSIAANPVFSIVINPGNHIPFGSLDCNGSGCHTTSNVSTGGFKLGAASFTAPTLSVAGHTTVAAAVAACLTCHESAPYVGMIASSATAWGDSRPQAFDSKHPATGDCIGCHTTSPTFMTDQTGNAKPANHVPTTAACAQCHTTAGNFAAYSVTGTHQGVTGCLSCHGSTVATTFANVTMVTNPANHFPFGSLDCNGSGCHTTSNVNTGGFKLGAASFTAPTLSVAGHTTVAAAVAACLTCHESAPYVGMIASSATAWGDSRPQAFDKAHPATGDCNGCHTTAPTFMTDQTGNAKPANHIPTTAACAQCHTTAGNYAAYSVTGTHQGVTGCLSCHGSTVATTFANITIVTHPGNHFPFGSLDCNGSGCHTTSNVNTGGFKLGAASLTAPTLSVAGHTTAAAAVAACLTCHESAPYVGMIASSATAWGDSRPQAFDKAHPATGDCNGCHSTSPTFATNQMGTAAKPANHIPTTAPCAQCHTTAGNYGAYVMGATGHAGITNNCAKCHAYGLSFYNMAAPTLKQPTAGATGHIPSNPPNGTASLACELCHSASNFATFSGTIMKHAYVVSMQCMACHEYNSTWQTNAGTQLWRRPGQGHFAGRDCGGSGCHTARDRFALRPVARPATTAPSGTPVKPATHIASTNNCLSCHTTVAWLPVRTVDHTQVKGSCLSCHNGVIAKAKSSGHVPTSAGCESCHTTNAWTPARFDHAAVAPHVCMTCHNAVKAAGMPRTHIPTTQACDVCHGTLAWKPAKIDHSTFTSACARCHNNLGAVGMPSGHMSTRIDCGTCHTHPNWTVLHFRHVSAAYPGSHRAALSCTSCHSSNTDQIPWRSPANAGNCAGCHAADFKPAAHPKTVKGQSYTANELANCSGACHVYSGSTQSTITKSLPGPYHRVSDAAFKR